MDESGNAKPDAGLSPERRPRWGLRTLGFLGLAFIAVVTSAALGHHTVGTLGSLLFGLIGAAYCSVRGVRGAVDDDAVRILIGRRRSR